MGFNFPDGEGGIRNVSFTDTSSLATKDEIARDYVKKGEAISLSSGIHAPDTDNNFYHATIDARVSSINANNAEITGQPTFVSGVTFNGDITLSGGIHAASVTNAMRYNTFNVQNSRINANEDRVVLDNATITAPNSSIQANLSTITAEDATISTRFSSINATNATIAGNPIFTGTPTFQNGANGLSVSGGGENYILPTASTTVKGGVKVGDGLSMNGADSLSVDSSILTAVDSWKNYSSNDVRNVVSRVTMPASGTRPEYTYINLKWAETEADSLTVRDNLDVRSSEINAQSADIDLKAASINLNKSSVTAGDIPCTIYGNPIFNGTPTFQNGANGLSVSGGGENYILPTASTTVKGGVKVGNGLRITNESLAVDFGQGLTADSTYNNAIMVATGVGLTLANNEVVLSPATSSNLGGVRIGNSSGMSVTSTGSVIIRAGDGLRIRNSDLEVDIEEIQTMLNSLPSSASWQTPGDSETTETPILNATITKSQLETILAKFNVTVQTPPEPDTTPADTVSATPPSDLTFAAVYTNPSTLTVFAGGDDTYAVTVSVHIANPNYYDASTWGTNQPCQLGAYTENGSTELEVLDPEEMDDDYNVTEHIISDISYLGLSVDTGNMLVADYRVTLFDPSFNYDYSVFSIFFFANNLAGTGSRQSNPLYAYVADPKDPT